MISYYVSIGSIVLLIPCGCLAAVSGITAIVFGVRGLRYAKDYPEARGALHAWFGIILGSFCTLLGLLCGSAMFLPIIARILDL